MANIPFMPPGNGVHNPCKVNGRSYATALGSYVIVPDYDAAGLDSNGWIRCAQHGVGVTASRPVIQAGTQIGTTFLDTTLAANVIWDGWAWRAHSTGATA
jgi:hypothetical protein